MRAYDMIKHSNEGRRLLSEVQEGFTDTYPYLKIEFPGIRMSGMRPSTDETRAQGGVTREWLEQELGLSDRMTVRELEIAISTYFGVDVLVFRKSGKFWIETRMTRDWTLKRQNDHGSDLEAGL